MAIQAYMHIESSQGGTLTEGCGVIGGHEDEVLLESLQHDVVIPRERYSGMATGQRVHEPFIVTKHADKSTPLLVLALCNNTRLDEVTIKLYRPNPAGDGTQEYYFTFVLTNARVSYVKRRITYDRRGSGENTVHLEEVAFVYENIRWTYEPSGTEHEDQWVTPSDTPG
jgi:type VI secretion system secreted protein Hcp